MSENKDNSIFKIYEEVKDRDGKVHRVYSCKLKDLSKLTAFTTKYNPTNLQLIALLPWLDDKGNPKTDKDGNVLFMHQNPEFMDAIFEIIGLALNKEETREQIEVWIDFSLVVRIIDIFLGLSQFKKKEI